MPDENGNLTQDEIDQVLEQGEYSKSPKPEADRPKQIPAVMRSKWPNKLQLSKLNDHGIGQDIELMMSAGSDTIDMEINEQDYEDSHYLSVCIDKEMAVKIVNYLRNHYNI